MKKLLLTLGAVASVAAPVAAVVACSSDSKEPTLDGIKNGSDVKHAFVDHLTYGELASHVSSTFTSTEFDTLKTAAGTFDSALNGAEAGSAGAATRETAITAFITAVDTFNSANVTLPATFTSTLAGEKTLFDKYQGKKIKAVLFYQDAEDKVDNAGAATLVLSDKGEDWTNADNDWNEMADKAKGFDETNSSHSITGDNFGIRFDIVA